MIMKKLNLLLVCMVSALNISAEVYSGSCGTNAKYSLNTSTGVLSITGKGAMNNYYANSPSPWESQRTYIKTVDIANGITSIGANAFWDCFALTSVSIPNSVISIERDAFSYCSHLTSVTIPSSVTSIGTGAFIRTGLTSVTIPNSVTSIGNNAFNGCSGLTSVTIPNSVTSIGNYAFQYCSGLTSIDIPNSVTSIGNSAFNSCSGLTSITIPNSVTSIGSSAFYGCSGLISVTCEATSIPSTGSDIFYNVPLSSATLYVPNSALENYKTTAPWKGFGNIEAFVIISGSCGENVNYILNLETGILSITGTGAMTDYSYSNKEGVPWYERRAYIKSVEISGGVTSIGSSAFYDCSGLTSVTIPNSVTSIGESAFENCFGLTSITIPNSVTSIGTCAFFYCSGLTSVTIPNSVTYIGDSAFCMCSELTSIIIPNSVTYIEEGTFLGCSGLTSIDIPNSVTYIGYYAFEYCTSLNSVTCKATSVPSTEYEVFADVPQSKATLYVPNSALEDYKATAPWSDFGTIIAIPDVLRGDANSDGKVDMDDATFVTNIILGIETATEAADVNNDGTVNMPDAMFIVNKILNGKFPDEE